MKFLEVRMKNLDESHNAGQPEGEVISLQEHRTALPHAEESLVPKRQTEAMRERWKAIQASFVDEPRKAVQDADELVESTVQHIEEVFRSQRSQMEQQWSGGKDASTEDLRLSLQRYRTFFDRLLSL